MRIQVVGHDESSNAQARTYAEYRVFAALARHTQRVGGATVTLRRVGASGGPEVVCHMTVALLPSGTAETHASGPHAYAAINRLVSRIHDLMGRLTEDVPRARA
jgi:hypothetical protein